MPPPCVRASVGDRDFGEEGLKEEENLGEVDNLGEEDFSEGTSSSREASCGASSLVAIGVEDMSDVRTASSAAIRLLSTRALRRLHL